MLSRIQISVTFIYLCHLTRFDAIVIERLNALCVAYRSCPTENMTLQEKLVPYFLPDICQIIAYLSSLTLKKAKVFISPLEFRLSRIYKVYKIRHKITFNTLTATTVMAEDEVILQKQTLSGI